MEKKAYIRYDEILNVYASINDVQKRVFRIKESLESEKKYHLSELFNFINIELDNIVHSKDSNTIFYLSEDDIKYINTDENEK